MQAVNTVDWKTTLVLLRVIMPLQKADFSRLSGITLGCQQPSPDATPKETPWMNSAGGQVSP